MTAVVLLDDPFSGDRGALGEAHWLWGSGGELRTCRRKDQGGTDDMLNILSK